MIAVLAIGVFATALLASQALAPASAQTNEDTDDDERSTISTAGTATTKVTPDKVSLTVGVETDGANATEAVSKNAELTEKVIAALKGLGIRDDQLSTGYFSVYPTYEYNYPPCILEQGGGMSDGSSGSTDVRPEIYPPPPECQPKNVITGYKASNSLTVTLEGNADVGEVIDTAVEAGANSINGAYFFVSQERQEQIREGLIAEAIENAKSRADRAASAVDMNITGVKSINLNDVYFPIFNEKFASADAGVAGSTPILPGEQEISMTVQVTYFMG
ncbi:MAG: SIMPL domain-containing protein [Thermodesulfobacteriota bacterium]